MLDWLEISPATLIALITGGSAAIVAILAIITAIYTTKKARKEYQITKEGVVEGFKEAVIPSKIQLDLATSLNKFIAETFPKLEETVKSQIAPLVRANLLMLQILANTAAANKLTDEQKAQMQQIYNYLSEITMTVSV